MGERFQGNWRVLAATLFSAALVVGAYLLARGIETPALVQASTESALLQAIAEKDSDGDGLADWEEALYGTDTHIPDSFKLGMTDGEAVAKGLVVPKAITTIKTATSTAEADDASLTSAFAKSFFALYLSAKQSNGGVELTADEANVVATQALDQLVLTASQTPDFKTAADIKVSGTGPDALRAFAIAAEAVLMKNVSDATKSELEYLQSAVEGTDATATAHLAALAKSYRDSAVGLAVLAVPSELAAAHLAIVNALMRLSEIYVDFSRVDSDPLTTMLALQQFKPTELAAEEAFRTLADIYRLEGVVLASGAPGASFVNIMADITARQQAQNP
jgi:hypothetical protein